MKAHHSRAQHMTSHCITRHDTTQEVTSHQITWHDNHITWHLATNHITSSQVTSQSTALLHLTPQPTSWHHNTSHHHHGTVEGSFTPKSRFGHPLAYSFSPFQNFCPRLARLYLVVWYLILLFDRMQTSLPWWDGSPNSKRLVDLNSNGSSLKSKVETKISGLGAGVGAKSTHHVFWWSFLTVIMHFPPSGVDKAWSKPDSMFEVNLWRWRGAK